MAGMTVEPIFKKKIVEYFYCSNHYTALFFILKYVLMDATSGAGTASLPEHLSSPPVFSAVGVTGSLVLSVCFVDRCLSFWLLCCLSFFDLQILITPSNSS